MGITFKYSTGTKMKISFIKKKEQVIEYPIEDMKVIPKIEDVDESIWVVGNNYMGIYEINSKDGDVHLHKFTVPIHCLEYIFPYVFLFRNDGEVHSWDGERREKDQVLLYRLPDSWNCCQVMNEKFLRSFSSNGSIIVWR